MRGLYVGGEDYLSSKYIMKATVDEFIFRTSENAYIKNFKNNGKIHYEVNYINNLKNGLFKQYHSY